MSDLKRKSLDECSDESERFQSVFEQFLEGERDESAGSRLITEITNWLQDCARQGRFIPMGSADRRAFRSLLGRWSSRLRRQGLHVDGIDHLEDFDPSAGIALTVECPYPGLDPFTERRRDSFFGREAFVSSSVAHFGRQGNRVQLIIGASGSGKSSLALAGIVPRLMELHDGAWLFGPVLTPGAHPLAELAESVAQAVGHPDQASKIERGLAAEPGGALGQLAELCPDKPLMLLIDQFEELLTLCSGTGEQIAFAQVLCALSDPAASTGGFCCKILLTLRTDHLARFESDNALRLLHIRLVGEDNERYLSAIGIADIKRAIKEPANQVGLRFIPAALIDQLAAQTAGLSNGLPLLQFALRRLWDTRPRNDSAEPLDLINEEMVQALPDVERALGAVAERVFQTFSSSQQRICERLLLELLVLDESFEEPLRRRRNEAELREVLEARFATSGDVDRVIGDFVKAGLLRRFGDGPHYQLEVAHEALLRHWNRIYRLVTGAECKERLHLIKQIGRQARDWESHGRKDDYLSLKGERLEHAIAHAEDGWLVEAELAAYIESCKRQEAAERLREQRAREEEERAIAAERARDAAHLRAARFRRNMWRMAAGAVLILAGFLGWGWYKVSERSFAQNLAMTAEGALKQGASQRGLLLAIEAARHGRPRTGGLLPEVEKALRSALGTSPVLASIRSYSRIRIGAAIYSPDGSTLALGDSLGGVSLWDVATAFQQEALFAHVDEVGAIAFSPDGRKMASGSDDGNVVVWDTESSEPVHTLNAHVKRVSNLAFSRPDGRLLATASDDGSVFIWDAVAGLKLRALLGHSGPVETLAFGRDERQLMTAGEDERVIFWDALRGVVLYSLDAEGLFDADLTADGSLLAVALQGGEVEIWDTATRGRRLNLIGHTNSVSSVRFSRDGSHVATASFDSTVRVWRIPRGDLSKQQAEEVLKVLRPTSNIFPSLAFSPTGGSVAATSIDTLPSGPEFTAFIWSVGEGGELLTVPTGFDSPVKAVAFSPNGKTITVGGVGGRVQTLDLSGKRLDVAIQGNPTNTKAVAISHKGVIAIGDGEDVLVAQPGESDPLRLLGHQGIVNDLAFSPDGSRLVSASDDGTAIVWELPAGSQLRALKGHTAQVLAVAFSPDGKTIATGSRDSSIRMWRDDTEEPPQVLRGHWLGILDLAFSSDGQTIVSGSKDKTVRLWDVVSGDEEDTIRGHSNVVSAVAIHGDQLATAGDDGIRLWDLRSREFIQGVLASSHGADSLAFSPDGRLLAAGGAEGAVRVYAMQSEELVDLAEKRVRRGWTEQECKEFLAGKPCPQSRYKLLDEANQRFENLDLEEGEQLLRRAKVGGGADAELIDAEVDLRLGSAFLWAASSAFEDPEVWSDLEEGQTPEELAKMFLNAARDKSTRLVFDPDSRWIDLNAYAVVKQARALAREGKLEQAVKLFDQARTAGWQLPAESDRVAQRVFAIALINNAMDALKSRLTSEQLQSLVEELEQALRLIPGFGPGHEVLAELYVRQNDLENAERQYLEAGSIESGAEPFISLGFLTVEQKPEQAIEYATKALDRDRGSNEAWFVLGYAEYKLEHYQRAVEALDQVSEFADFSVDALNLAGSIYFDRLKNDQAAYQRMTRAVQLAPDDLSVLSNYAEFLLASGRYDQAKWASARARELARGQGAQEDYIRAVMSFVLFSAELLTGEHESALTDLEALERDVKAAAKLELETPWLFSGIRRSLRNLPPSEQSSALLQVLKFVETDGREGSLDDMRRHLGSEPQNG